MNQLWSALDRYTLISNSDAYSGEKLGREANLLSGEISFPALRAALRKDTGPARFEGTLEFYPVWRLLVLGFATSIDAAAVGVTFAMLEVSILQAILVIGLVTLVLSFLAALIGQRVGVRLRKPAEFAGGLVLIAIGLRILLEYLGLLA